LNQLQKKIFRDREFWHEKRKKVCLIYTGALLPEIIDPPKKRDREVRNIKMGDIII
jgi:hypothetical protein